MTDLSTALDGLDARVIPGPSCGMAAILRTILDTDKPLHDKLLTAIDGTAPATKIADLLVAAGHTRATGVLVRRHRARSTSRGCACTR